MTLKAYAIFGPPGTGKTTETIKRMGQLRDVTKIDPNKIGFFSFTRAAAGEALKRLGLTRSDKISTLHALMFRRFEVSTVAVVDAWKLRKFGDQIGMPFAGVSNDQFEQMEIGDQFNALWSLARARMRSLKEEYDASSRPGTLSQFEFFVDSYESWKKALGLVDYTDMLQMYLERPFNHGAEALFIDEAQDLSPLQWAIIDRMADPSVNPQLRLLTIAGDDDQAIFEWAGADPGGMARFCERYNAKITILGQSYRVPQKPHELANRIIRTVGARVEKEYKPRDDRGRVDYHPSFEVGLIRAGVPTMILARSFVARKEIEDELVARCVAYRTEGGRPGLYHTKWAEAIRAYETLVAGGEIGQVEARAMSAVASPGAAAFINNRDFGGLVAMCRGDRTRAFKIPPAFIDFYRSADLFAQAHVTLSTIHAAKGREADDVILHTGVTARTLADMEHNPDAEARVWYVAVTRTRERLVLIDSDSRCPLL
jgi:superfamily I DNA/RNA helicase